MGDPKAMLVVDGILIAYWTYVKQAYSKETRRGTVVPTLRRLCRVSSQTRVVELGPLRLKAFRNSLIEERSRPTDDGSGPSRPLCDAEVSRLESHVIASHLASRAGPSYD